MCIFGKYKMGKKSGNNSFSFSEQIENIIRDIKNNKYKEANIQYSKYYYSQDEINRVKTKINERGLNYVHTSDVIDTLRIF